MPKVTTSLEKCTRFWATKSPQVWPKLRSAGGFWSKCGTRTRKDTWFSIWKIDENSNYYMLIPFSLVIAPIHSMVFQSCPYYSSSLIPLRVLGNRMTEGMPNEIIQVLAWYEVPTECGKGPPNGKIATKKKVPIPKETSKMGPMSSMKRPPQVVIFVIQVECHRGDRNHQPADGTTTCYWNVLKIHHLYIYIYHFPREKMMDFLPHLCMSSMLICQRGYG